MRLALVISVLAASSGGSHLAAQGAARRPIIDMHLHTGPWAVDALKDSAGRATVMREIIDSLDKYNVVLAYANGSYPIAVQRAKAAPGRIVASAAFPCEQGRMPNRGPACFENGAVVPDTAWLRAEHKAGRLGGIGELVGQYTGIAPADPRLAPTWALAEELGIPVAIHMGMGPPGAAYADGVCGPSPCAPNFRMALADPLLLEPVLLRHPKLKVYVMHAGWPFLDHMMALMYAHPGVHADIAVWAFTLPTDDFEASIMRFVKAGFGKRLLFGTDFPEFGKGIAAIENITGLTEAQKADIFHDNAARFLGLTGAR